MRRLRPLTERPSRATRARLALPPWLATALPPVAVAIAVAVFARHAAPLANGVSRPAAQRGLGAVVDGLFRRGALPAAEGGASESTRGDWILVDSAQARAAVVRCLTSANNADCELQQRPVAERAIACAAEDTAPCADDRPVVRVCQIPVGAGVSREPLPVCTGNPGATQWILFTNRDLSSSPRELERSCQAEIRRWCVWRPRSLEAPPTQIGAR